MIGVVRRSIAFSCLVFLASASLAAVRPYAERVQEAMLSNGLKVILLEDHKAPVAVVQVWYRVGGRNEVAGRSGLSHLLEHMMFKGGTETVGPEEYTRIIQRSGGETNAFTSQDYTTYFVTIASDRIGVVLSLEADRMHHLRFDEDLYAAERLVVMEERRLRVEDNPVAALFEQLDATAYAAHPYRIPIIGWMSDVGQSTVEDLAHHYRTYYVPNNAFLVVVGDFDSQQLLAEIREEFDPVAPGPMPPTVRSREPIQRGERRVELRREAELPFVALAFHVPNLRSRDAAALEVLSQILSGGKSARLYKRLVYEQRLSRQAGADYDYVSLDPGLFMLFAQPLPGRSIGATERALLMEIEKVREAPPTAREIRKAKNGIEAAFVFAQDSLFYQALLLGQYEIAGDWRGLDHYLEAVQAVTGEDLSRVARFYLDADNRTVANLRPVPGSIRRNRPETLPAGPID